MNVRTLGMQALEALRDEGRAGMNTGVSNPVPARQHGEVVLCYFLQDAVFQPPYQIEYEPTAHLVIDYETGRRLAFQPLAAASPAVVVGRYPHAAARSIPLDQWESIWEEFWRLYPAVIDAFAGRAAPGDRAAIGRFREIWALLTPPYMEPYYSSLNPAFFDWLVTAS